MAGPTKKAAPKAGQRSILGFFKPPSSQLPSTPTAKSTEKPKLVPISGNSSRVNLTPAPSSDAPKPEDDDGPVLPVTNKSPGLPSPVTPADIASSKLNPVLSNAGPALSSSPSRRSKRTISYAESDDEDKDDVKPPSTRRRQVKRQKIEDSEDEDVFMAAASEVDEGMYLRF